MLSSSASNQLNKGNNRKINFEKWRDNKMKVLRIAIKAHVIRKGHNVPAMSAANLVRGKTF